MSLIVRFVKSAVMGPEQNRCHFEYTLRIICSHRTIQNWKSRFALTVKASVVLNNSYSIVSYRQPVEIGNYCSGLVAFSDDGCCGG